ncbi:hypothetical protein [Limimaricola pyoseonensis]|uniref:DUF4410 domain-containing protein n=1 Tax=Limimaricola pyoseonensis TaxID=521013 RepID=A0A1G7C8X5_9RHOB|nr:hypothetical protein [Limimaricola pyoseonensis]SDE35781.1 hypothetical protein SAMN04488567_1405 [Limimaricola pyoseonensis]
MFTRRSLIALAAAATLAACGTPDPNPLSRSARAEMQLSTISVATEGTGFESGAAQRFSSRLAPDLETALAREFADRLGRGGQWQMQVDVSRLNVAGGTSTAFGRDQSRLSGAVRIIDPSGALRGSYTIQVLAGEAAEGTGGALLGAAVNSAGGYYRDLLEAFARDARMQVLGADLPGQRILRRVSN